MKEQWNILVQLIQKLVTDDAAVMNGLRSGTDVGKIKKNFTKNVKELSSQVEKFQMFIPDPANQQIELPFSSKKFADAWMDYKEFLLAVHNVVLTPIEERYRLNKVYNLSGKSEEKALEMIELFIVGRYKLIFKPKDFNQVQIEEEEAEVPFSTQARTL